jgi:hypothetical protein
MIATLKWIRAASHLPSKGGKAIKDLLQYGA